MLGRLSLLSLWLATLRRAETSPPPVPPGRFLEVGVNKLCTSGCDAAARRFSSSLHVKGG